MDKREEKEKKCTYDPSTLIDVPIGMFHCPECGEMVMAGLPHPDNNSEISMEDFMDKPKNDKIVAYIPTDGNTRKITFVGVLIDNIFQIGYSIRNKKDRPNKKLGIQIAEDRARNNPSFKITVNNPMLIKKANYMLPNKWKNYFKDFLYMYAKKTYMELYDLTEGEINSLFGW